MELQRRDGLEPHDLQRSLSVSTQLMAMRISREHCFDNLEHWGSGNVTLVRRMIRMAAER